MELEQKRPRPSCHLHRYTSFTSVTGIRVFKSVSQQVCQFCWPHVSIHWSNGKTQVVPFLCQLFSPGPKIKTQHQPGKVCTTENEPVMPRSQVLVFRKSGVLYAWGLSHPAALRLSTRDFQEPLMLNGIALAAIKRHTGS